jgi:hypothetical protein
MQDCHGTLGLVNNSRACVAFFSEVSTTRQRQETGTLLIRNKFLATSIYTITRKDGFFILRDSLLTLLYVRKYAGHFPRIVNQDGLGTVRVIHL